MNEKFKMKVPPKKTIIVVINRYKVLQNLHFLFQDSIYSYVLKGLISLSTGILLGLIVLYHTREIQVCNKTQDCHN